MTNIIFNKEEALVKVKHQKIYEMTATLAAVKDWVLQYASKNYKIIEKYKYNGLISNTLFTDLIFLKQYIYLRNTDDTKRAKHIIGSNDNFIVDRILLMLFWS